MNSETPANNNALKHFYEFGAFRLDPQEKLLLRQGERVPLTLKACETLLVLVENHGHIVEKAELMQRIWPDTVVEENNLTQNISAIRKALGGNGADQHFIETLPRRGYRFVGTVREQRGETAASPPILQDISTPLSASVPRLNRTARIALVAVLLVLVGLGIFYLVRNRTAPALATDLNTKINRLPATNDAWETAISPDGSLVAYVVGDAGQQSLWLKQVETGTDKELLPQQEMRFRGLAFAPDGKSLYYAQQQKDSDDHVLYQKPIQGGEGKRLLNDVDSSVTFSPDGKQLAFVRESHSKGESALVVANVDGSRERIVATRKMPNYYAVEGLSWSPDGKVLAVAAANATPKFHFQILTVQVESGQEAPIGTSPWGWAAKVVWVNAQRLAMIARTIEGGTDNKQLWLLEYPSGQARKLLNDLNDYRSLSVRQDGQAIVTVRSETRADLWVLPEADAQRAHAITTDSASQNGEDGLDWTPDNRIVYTSLASGHKNLWVVQANGTQAKPLTTEEQDNAAAPSVMTNGQQVVFNSGRSGSPRVWRIGLDGQSPTELTHGSLDLSPFCGGDFVYFSQRLADKRQIYRLRTDGAEPAQALTDKLTEYPAVSPDGKLVACLYQETPASPRQVAILPATGGAAIQKLSISVFPSSSLRWHPNGKALTYLTRQDGAMNVWQQPLSGGAPEKLTDFKAERLFAYAWSRDGRTLACSRGTAHRDVVMISEVGIP
jgi:Tol biopolymer transport system component/DNA-binding winged helix-turn-helix (wHTH) protein